ncbi:MAG: DUF3891 family protein [Bryobacteraceae bacterium]|nr:DUF3891 family protein [Bryobacteraceae bacterium]
MLRLETATGWWLVTHPDHAHLAGDFAAAWGNDRFRAPEPRARVLHGIRTHDDGWAARDARPSVTREGKPAAFSVELVGKYSAFEEIDLVDYLAVRDRAVRLIAEADPYAGLLISLHTENLLTQRADRSTIAPQQLPLLDEFLAAQARYQQTLRERIGADESLTEEERDPRRIQEHFRLLQACDNLSLLACVDYAAPAHLLHPLPLCDLCGGGASEVQVKALAPRHFQLTPWPFATPSLDFAFPARHVEGHRFATSGEFASAYQSAATATLSVRLSA